jgi:hypothetical protein
MRITLILAVVLLVVVAGIVLFRTMSGTPQAVGGGPQVVPKKLNPCRTGSGHQGPIKPVVCIDLTTFDKEGYKPDPDPVWLGRGQHIEFWFKQGSGKLEIQFTADTPVQNNCQNEDNYWADAKPDVPEHADIHRKYTIIDRKSGRHADPEVVIEPR